MRERVLQAEQERLDGVEGITIVEARKSIQEKITYSEERRYKDYRFFMDHCTSFYKEYGKGYIAIRDRRVLGHFRSIISAYKALTKQYPAGTYLIQECIEDKDSYHESIQSVFLFE